MFAQDRLSADSNKCATHCAGGWLPLALSLLLALLPYRTYAESQGEFQVENAHTWKEHAAYMLDAQFDVRLSSGAREALENGVPLVFEFQVQVVKINNWFWDTVDIELLLRRQLQYHALSRSYLVKDLSAGTQGNYRRLEDAVRAAGSIGNLVLTEEDLQSDKRYLVRIRGRLDIESLPTPVRLLAYVSSAWDMASEWYTWPLER